MQDYYAMFMDAVGMFIFLGVELSVLFILIAAAVSLLQQYIPDSKVQAFLSNSHGRGYILAALLGAITPFCSCSTIPMLRGLLKAKAGFGPTLTFLFASPLLNPIIIALFVATFGLKVSIIYTSVALLTSILAGYILHKMQFEQYVMPESATSHTASCCASSSEPVNDVCACKIQEQEVRSACCSTTQGSQNKEQCCGGHDSEQSLQELNSMQELHPLSKLNSLQELKPLQAKKSVCACATELKLSEEVECNCYFNEQVPTSSCCSSANPVESACCSASVVVSKSSCCSTASAPTSACCSTSSVVPQNSSTWKQRIGLAFKEAWGQFKQVFPYLLFGVSLGALVYGFVPSDFIAKYASGDSLWAVPISAVIGIPLYVRVEALIPLSAVLVGKGMGLGAVMALIIGGGGASLTEVILLKSMFRMPMIIAFLTIILGMAIMAGYLFQFFV